MGYYVIGVAIIITMLAYSYLRQVLDETLRWAATATFAARYQDVETELGGHVIPAGVSAEGRRLANDTVHNCRVPCQPGNQGKPGKEFYIFQSGKNMGI